MDKSISPRASPQITFSDVAVIKCPFSAYEALREDHPVYQDPVSGHYILTRYAHIRKALLNTKALSNKTGVVATRESEATEETNRLYTEHGWVPVDTLVTNDPPSHRTFRSLVDKAFIPEKMALYEPRIAEIVNQLIDGLIDKPEVDFVAEFAVKMPILVFSELLGITDCDVDRFKFWSDTFLQTSSPVLDPKREIEIAHHMIEFQQYLATNIERVRAVPDDTLLGRLVHAEVDGRRLDMQELVSILQLLFVAGAENTTAAIAAGVKLMIDTPSVVAEIRNDPDRLNTFIEETLRMKSPTQTMFRRATQDLEIADVRIPEGAIVEVRFGAANLDPDVYPDPERLDVCRANAHTHLAFGSGIHICIGNQLARAEMRLAFQALVDKMDNLRASRGADSYSYNTDVYLSYGITKLWLAFDRR